MSSDDPTKVQRSDVLLTVAMVTLAFFTVFVLRDRFGAEIESVLPEWGDHLATALLLIPIAFRRTHPLTVGVWIGVGFAAYRLLRVPEDAVSSAAVFLALFAVGAYSADRRGRAVVRTLIAGLSLIALLVALFRNVDFVTFEGAALAVINISVNFAFFAAAWILGEVWRQRQEAAAELQRRAAQLAAERELRARRAVVEERVRISRELHDVVAHHVSVMGVQAAGARAVLDRDPDRAKEALEAVEQAGRTAVAELQKLVGLLREEEDAGSAAPQPTMDDIEDLVRSTTRAGLPVTLRRVGRSRRVPSSVALSVYRIVQEALTNIVKHAPGAPTTVVITYTSSGVGVEVVNQPSLALASAEPGGGRGMIGMRERASMLGGTFTAGPVAGGGYRVAADLPSGTSFDTEAVPS